MDSSAIDSGYEQSMAVLRSGCMHDYFSSLASNVEESHGVLFDPILVPFLLNLLSHIHTQCLYFLNYKSISIFYTQNAFLPFSLNQISDNGCQSVDRVQEVCGVWQRGSVEYYPKGFHGWAMKYICKLQ